MAQETGTPVQLTLGEEFVQPLYTQTDFLSQLTEDAVTIDIPLVTEGETEAFEGPSEEVEMAEKRESLPIGEYLDGLRPITYSIGQKIISTVVDDLTNFDLISSRQNLFDVECSRSTALAVINGERNNESVRVKREFTSIYKEAVDKDQVKEGSVLADLADGSSDIDFVITGFKSTPDKESKPLTDSIGFNMTNRLAKVTSRFFGYDIKGERYSNHTPPWTRRIDRPTMREFDTFQTEIVEYMDPSHQTYRVTGTDKHPNEGIKNKEVYVKYSYEPLESNPNIFVGEWALYKNKDDDVPELKIHLGFRNNIDNDSRSGIGNSQISKLGVKVAVEHPGFNLVVDETKQTLNEMKKVLGGPDEFPDTNAFNTKPGIELLRVLRAARNRVFWEGEKPFANASIDGWFTNEGWGRVHTVINRAKEEGDAYRDAIPETTQKEITKEMLVMMAADPYRAAKFFDKTELLEFFPKFKAADFDRYESIGIQLLKRDAMVYRPNPNQQISVRERINAIDINRKIWLSLRDARQTNHLNPHSGLRIFYDAIKQSAPQINTMTRYDSREEALTPNEFYDLEDMFSFTKEPTTTLPTDPDLDGILGILASKWEGLNDVDRRALRPIYDQIERAVGKAERYMQRKFRKGTNRYIENIYDGDSE